MAKTSSGLLMYRLRGGTPEMLLVHPGGPFWRNKDEGAWTIPKGEVADGEDLLSAAKREFEEELGVRAAGDFAKLTAVKQKGGKTVYAWAFEGDLDTTAVRSNTFTMEWPPRSGKQAEFPEVDRAAFFDIKTAKAKINAAQVPLLVEVEAMLLRA
jgi:predicted NUDIX family NTP pyrophosphohydrolase